MTTPTVTFDITPEQEASKLQFIRRQFSGAPPAVSRADADLDGQTAIVTGANGGIGLECCRQLLDLGVSNLVLAVRDEHKGEIARETLMAAKSSASQNVEVWRLDYASYESVVTFARRAETVQPPLGIAILNAGVNRGSFALNPETGHEEDVQTNYLSTALLTLLLLRAFKSTNRSAPPTPAPGRIVVVSSDTAAWANFAEKDQDPLLPALDTASQFRVFDRYATTKLLGQLFVAELARRVPASAAVVNCANPGLCHGSALNRELGLPAALLMRLLGRSAAVGARSLVSAATMRGERGHGQYIEDCVIRPMAPFVYSEEAKLVSQRLWKETMAELSFAGVEKIVEDLS
ncbi:short-chain dehydrogenase/reductase family protein [Apiospora rasikravindrae]|uniref:Short-chain dehydrogenase/reductase family protein n=1 Tax=Apiospora rasikravindrae TaxID=990691 RepID=A0ABR1RPB1_9PEZI